MSNEQTKKQDSTKVDLGENLVGEVELPKFDPMPFVGKKSKIASVETHCHPQNGYYAKVITEPVAEFNGNEITASRNFGLVLLEDGKVGWGNESKLANFLKEMGVKTLNDLKGKEVTLQVTDANADGVRYLRF